ncbi:PKD domain-containing protein [Humisphaera borealis]|uniref:PKD domain-containing protein n=1 Tax=Humisphaera borealis TaxID=2807512 RepID=A0A7M2WT91_9BACT|nr:hypothetical protein [Humisphaera borealis]QOV88728.1 hypothetical protein IPV69_21230 [Humisphaera borealis]
MSVSTDSQGWTVVTPSVDTRVVYVAANGSDANDGLSPATPVASITKARTLVRPNSPDWLLLRRGDTFSQRFDSWDISGRSASEPFVVGAYTDPAAPSTARPQLNTGIATGFGFSLRATAASSHVYIMGLAFEANRRDFRDPPSNFTSDWNGDGSTATYGLNGSNALNNILVEDCSFQYYKMGVVFQSNPTNIQLRRSIIADSWAVNVDAAGNALQSGSAANGIYTDTVNGLTIDGNIFSHNGWVDNNALFARQNIFSHNLYLNTGNSNVSVTNNIIADSASHGLQMRAGGIVKGNLFLRNPIAMSFGLVNGAVKAGGVYGEISDNVVVGSSSIFLSPRGWGIELTNLKPASQGGGTVIRNNVFANDNQNNGPAIKLDQSNTTVPDVGINDLLIEQNIVYSWFSGISIHSSYEVTRTLSGLVVRQNDFQKIVASSTIADINGSFVASHQSWSGNRYDSLNLDPNAQLFKIGGVKKTLAQWQAQVEPTAQRVTGLFPDAGRTAGGYNASLGSTNSTDEFIRQAMRQSRSFWRTAYTADPVNDWIRAGYAGGRIDAAPPTATASAENITVAGGASQTITVTLSDDNKIDLASLGDGDIRVTGPGGFSAVGTLVSSTGPADGRKRTATYRISAPGGAWAPTANGLYSIALETGQVLDAAGRSAPADPIGSFSVSLDPAVPSAVATAPAIISDNSAATVTVTYTGATTPGLPTSVAPVNAGFETPNVAGQPGAFLYAPEGGGWTFANGAGIAADASAFTSANTVAPQGAQVAFIQATGTMSQNVTGWQSGTYTLSFKAAQRANNGVSAHDFQVLVDGVVVGTFQPGGIDYQPYATASVTVAAGDHTVEFRGLNTLGGDQTSLVDDIQITGVTAPILQQMSAASFDTADIRLTGSAGFSAAPTSVLADTTDGNQRVVVYTFAAPAGGWASTSSTLAVNVVSQQVSTTSGAKVPAGKIGTVAVGVAAPIVASVSAADVVAASTQAQTFVVRYTDDNPGTALPASLDSNDLRVTGPGGFNQPATLVSATGVGTTASPLVATYTVNAPAAGWSSVVNGTYWITAQSNQVVDADGNVLAPGAIDSFRVAVDTTPPLAVALEDDILLPTTGVKSIGVSYVDASGVVGGTLNEGDLRVVGPNGFDSPVTFVRSASDSTAAYADYTLVAPGKWQSRHNGTYSIVVQPNQVFDNVGNAVTTPTVIETFDVNIEKVVPTVTIGAVSPNPRNTSVGSITVNFSELVSGFDLSDISLTRNGVPVSLAGATISTTGNISFTIGNLSSVTTSGGAYTLTVNAAGAGIIDDAGNALASGSTVSWTTDVSKPTAVASASSVTAPTSAALTISVSYSDNLDVNTSTLDGSDVRVTGPNGFSAAASLVSVGGSAGNRTAVYSLAAPSGGWKSSFNGNYSIVLQSGQVADTAGNFADTGTIGSFSVALETTPPTVSLASVSPNPRGSSVASVSATFSEAVAGLDLADLSLTRNGVGVSLAGASVSTTDGLTYTLSGITTQTAASGNYVLTLTASGSGIVDLAGNALTVGAAVSWTTDSTPPQAAATAANVLDAGTSAVTIGVLYTDNTDVNASTFDNGDLLVTGPNGFSSSVTFVSSTGTTGSRTATYSLAAPAGGWKSSHNGTYSIVLQSSQVLDPLGNAAPAGIVGSFSVAVETTPPTVAFSTIATPRDTPVDSIGVTFSENVVGFDPSDLVLTRNDQPVAMAGVTISGSGNVYTVNGLLSLTAPVGSYRLSIVAPGGISDNAGNALAVGAAVSFDVLSNAVRPDLGFESPAMGAGQFQYGPSGSAWVFVNGAGLSGNGSGFTSGNSAAPQGDQVAFLQTIGRMSQTIDGFAGGSYTLSFKAAQRANIGLNVHDFEVVVDGTVVGTFQPTSANYDTYSTASFNLTAGAHTFAFRGLNTAGGDQTSFIDDVQILPVAPTISDVGPIPVSGSVFRQQLVIVGENFAADASVVLRDQGTGQALTDISIVSRSATQIVVSARLGATGGTFRAEVSGTNGTSQPFAFAVAAQPAVSAVGTLGATGVTADLSVTGVLGTGVTYTWSVLSGPAGTTFSVNGSASSASTATFAAAGAYTLQVLASDGTSSLTRTVDVVVDQRLKTLVVTPATVVVAAGAQQQYAATATDQFNAAMTLPAITWSLASGVGSVSATGLYTAPTTGGGSAVVQATSGTVVGTATLTAQAPGSTTSVAKIDFTTATGALAAGYLRDSGQTYAARGNGFTYGWTTNHADSVFDRDVNADQLVDTTLLMKMPARWEMAVTNGTYIVTVGVGDAAGESTANIWVEGVQLYNYVVIPGNNFSTRSISVTVSDGKLTIANGSAVSQLTRITHLDVARPATSPPTVPPPPPPPPPTGGTTRRIDFQPAAAPTVSGYVVDSGLTYGSRGNGLTYGWTVSHTDSVFDRNVNSDQRLDTVLAVKKGSKWNLAVANGKYSVTVLAGDPSAASTNNVWVEGNWTMQYVKAAANQFVSRTLTVTVTDGTLTLEFGGTVDKATRLSYIDITPVA